MFAETKRDTRLRAGFGLTQVDQMKLYVLIKPCFLTCTVCLVSA